MKGIRGLRLGLIGSLAVAVALIGGAVFSGLALAQSDTLSISSGSAAPGETATVDLEALDIGAPGLAAWSIDISYDPDVVSVEDCDALTGSVCNPNFTDDTIRISGATATGLEGDTLLARLTFECADAEGTTPLELTAVTFADATIGGPQDIDVTVSDGEFACVAEEEPAGLPPTGTGAGDSSGGLGWLIAGLAAFGVAGVVGYGALRLRTSRS